jgi:hypothetical protein
MIYGNISNCVCHLIQPNADRSSVNLMGQFSGSVISFKYLPNINNSTILSKHNCHQNVTRKSNKREVMGSTNSLLSFHYILSTGHETDRIANTASINSILECVFVAAGTCLPIRCQETAFCSGSIVHGGRAHTTHRQQGIPIILIWFFQNKGSKLKTSDLIQFLFLLHVRISYQLYIKYYDEWGENY